MATALELTTSVEPTTSTLASVHINTSSLSYPTFRLPQRPDLGWINGSSSPALHLAPGVYNFQQASGVFADFTFQVRDDGLITYDDRFEPFLDGKGTGTLSVLGLPVRLDPTALSAGIFLLTGAGAQLLAPDRAHDLRLAPAWYGFVAGSGIVANFRFRVEVSGDVSVEPQYSGFASAAGSTLTIRGYAITVDARSLSADLFPADLWSTKPEPQRLERTQTNQLTLVPARGYRFVAGSGIVANFAYEVDLSGNVVLDARYSGFATASGRSLTIRGYSISIDGRSLSHPLFPADLWGYTGGFLPRTTVNRLTLMPAAGYRLQPGSGLVGDMSYTVGIDGRISYPSDCESFLDGTSTNTLVVGGYPLLIDATGADSNLAGIPDIAVRADTPRYLFGVFLPCRAYRPQTANGVFMHGFNLSRSSAISFEPSLAGRYVVSTVPRLEIHGATPF